MFDFNAYFFDFDGTIGNTAPDIRGGWLAAIRKLQLPEDKFDAVFRIGPSIKDTAKLLYPEMPEIWPELQETYKYFYDQTNTYSNTAPYPGVLKKITELKQAGKKVYIVTNKRLMPLMKLAALFNLTDVCDGFFVPDIFDPANHFSKSELAHLAFRVSGVSADRALMVGDTDLDIIAGKYAGMKTCAVTWGYGKTEMFIKTSPDFQIDRIEDLP